jgi:hypothetical protein
MIATTMVWTWALMATGALPPVPSPTSVRLAPVRCTGLPDAAVREPLRVELGHRLLEDSAPDGPDVLLVSIACDGPDALVLAVRQNEGGAAVRRLVPFAQVALEARPRELAVAAVELIHVADVSDATPPPLTVVAVTHSPIPPPPPNWALALSPAALYFGGYFSNGFLNTGGFSFRIGVEHGPQWPASPSWQWGLTSEVSVFSAAYQTAYMAGLLALLQRRGPRLTNELGLGARAGVVHDYPMQATSTMTSTGGPVASLGVHLRLLPGVSWDVVAEGGYDFRGPGGWFLPRAGFTVRFQ